MEEQVVYRDEHGKVIDKKLWYQKRVQNKKKFSGKKKHKEYNNYNNINFYKYASGIVQYNKRKELEKYNEETKNDELIDSGRYYISKSYDEELKKRDLWDDPIKLINKTEDDLYINEDQTKLRCRYITPQNRFSIESGYRWDGVIRGNGFEEKFLLNENEKKNRNFIFNNDD